VKGDRAEGFGRRVRDAQLRDERSSHEDFQILEGGGPVAQWCGEKEMILKMGRREVTSSLVPLIKGPRGTREVGNSAGLKKKGGNSGDVIPWKPDVIARNQKVKRIARMEGLKPLGVFFSLFRGGGRGVLGRGWRVFLLQVKREADLLALINNL